MGKLQIYLSFKDKITLLASFLLLAQSRVESTFTLERQKISLIKRFFYRLLSSGNKKIDHLLSDLKE